MTGPLLLNLGSGPHVADDWVSVDASWNAWLAQRPVLRAAGASLGLLTPHHRGIPWPKSGSSHDVRKGLPFADDSAGGIYAAHFLEHLEPEEAAQLLAECRRVLAPGCAMRVVVPDLEALVRQYLDWMSGPEPRRAAGRFLESLNLAALRRWPSGWRWWPIRRLSRAGHRAVYDRHSMAALMAAAGFTDITPRAAGESRIPLIERVETPDRHEASICLEGTK